MDSETVVGQCRSLGGFVEQLTGQVRKALGSATETVGPLAGQVRRFARKRSWAKAALPGTIGVALIDAQCGKTTRS